MTLFCHKDKIWIYHGMRLDIVLTSLIISLKLHLSGTMFYHNIHITTDCFTFLAGKLS